MDQLNKRYIPIIILVFIAGLVMGYAVHRPATIERTVYINQTVEVPKIIEKIVEVTPAPIASPLITPSPAISSFTVKNYDPARDIPAYTINLRNWRADPDTLSIRPGDTVLIKIGDATLMNPMTLILNMSYSKDLGKSGAVIVTFDRRGIYSFKSTVASSDPNVLPRTYAEGTITVY